MENDKKISWLNLTIKIIIAVIIILTIVWAIAYYNKGLTNSLNVLIDDIFSKNINSMKEVGKEYFTTERLPEKVGDIKILSLEEMYNNNLILELTDKYGNACSAENSYVSIEKYENEYQMKVYLECGEENDFILVIMGCYDYCETDICESKESKKEENKSEGGKGNSTGSNSGNKFIEYEYIKTTGGNWGNWGNWSEWSKVSIVNTNYREVETKKENEEYTYNKTITETLYADFDISCSSGYTMTSDGSSCYKVVEDVSYSNPVCPNVSGYTNTGRDGFECTYTKTTTTTEDPTCPTMSGYTNTGRDGFECTYTKTTTTTADPVCPGVSGYTNIGRDGFTCSYSKTTTTTVDSVCPSLSGYTNTGKNGFTCNYSKTTTTTADPVCPSVSGYTNTGRNGFTCSYSKTTTTTEEPICPSKSGWTYTGRNGFTCNYSRTVTNSSYTLSYSHTATGSYVPADTNTYSYVQVSADYVYDCNNSCAFRWVYTYKVYKKEYGTTTETSTETANCPSGYSNVNGTCTSSTTSTKTATANCPSGYSNVNGTCTKSTTSTKTGTATCPSGYEDVDDTCKKTTTNEKIATANCKSGYTKDGNRCLKVDTSNVYKSLIKTCPSGYSKTSNGSKCYKKVLKTQTVTQVREVTYYRYRIREYIGGTIDYKWSSSKEDRELLNSGYTLTGRTR